MGKYLRLLRLSHQYYVVEVTLATAILIKTREIWMVMWIFSCLFLSITAFMINEIVDSKDTDKFTTNNVHIKAADKFNTNTVWLIFCLFSFLGILLSWASGLIWLGLIMFALGVFYSLKPIRLKGRFMLDNVSQMLGAIAFPILGPLIITNRIFEFWPDVLIFVFLIWFCIFPYQLADFKADLKAGIKPTHIVIGMKASLWLGMISLICGLVGFLGLNIIKIAWWTWIILPLVFCAIYSYIGWLKMDSLEKQLVSMRKYVKITVPLSQLAVPYLLIIWLFGF